MSKEDFPKVKIYTDGACNPNPGPGGWGAVLLHPGKPPIELSGHEENTTNNRMELRAAIEAFKALPEPHEVVIYTDSKYLRQGITEWISKWKAKKWMTTNKTSVKNQDLWQELSAEMERHRITWKWTRGHAGNKWNERADELARSEIARIVLPVDDERAIHIFTAASYLGKEKKGGWGVVLRYRDSIKTLSAGETNTSGNRMHICAAIEGLKAIKKPLPIHLYTTSNYLKDGATRWVKNWAKNNWMTKERTPVSHRDLWEELAGFISRYNINWHVVSKEDMPEEMVQAKNLATEAARTV